MHGSLFVFKNFLSKDAFCVTMHLTFFAWHRQLVLNISCMYLIKCTHWAFSLYEHISHGDRSCESSHSAPWAFALSRQKLKYKFPFILSSLIIRIHFITHLPRVRNYLCAFRKVTIIGIPKYERKRSGLFTKQCLHSYLACVFHGPADMGSYIFLK